MIAVRGVEVDSFPASRADNSQPHGIGRVSALPGLAAWSNLGRNIVFAGIDLEPRAVFDESVFAEDEPSQFDLDVHAILEPADLGLVLALNHLGMVRAFRSDDARRPGRLRRLTPVWTRTFVADVERAIVGGGRLVGSGPREERVPGLLVSEPLAPGGTRADLDVATELAAWGFVTALAPLADDRDASVALGSDHRVGVATVDDVGHVRLLWEAAVDFDPVFLHHDGTRLWAAGSESATVDDYDWEAQRGGGFAALDPSDGRAVVTGRFAADVAWGNGGVAVAVTPGALCAFGRRGEVHVFDPRDGAPILTSAPVADGSLGIAHGASVGAHLLYGFNRGGYRLYRVPLASIEDAVRSRPGAVGSR